MKFFHCADVHLDSPLKGLDAYEGAPVELLRGATRRALERLVERCREEKVDFLVIAGDLYDGKWKDQNTGLFFAKQMSLLREAGIKVFLVRGNHDAESTLPKTVRLPDNVHELRATKPETIRLEPLRVAIHGQSFASAAVQDDLAAAYPPAIAGWFNIGVLHTALEGRQGHATYAPCTLDTLRNKGYDYWALGHVHQREIIHPGDPHIVFPGNLQGRHARETDVKGATLVTVDNGVVTSLEHVPCDVLRWVRLEVDAEGASTPSDLLERIRKRLLEKHEASDGCALAARISLRGRTHAYKQVVNAPETFVADVRALVSDTSGGEIWAEKIEVHELRLPLDIETMRERDDAQGELLRSLAGIIEDEAARKDLQAAIEPLLVKLPVEARDDFDGIRLDNPDVLTEVLRDVEAILLSRLGDHHA